MTSRTCRDWSAAIFRSSSKRCWRPLSDTTAKVQPWASSTMTNSGHFRMKSSARREDLIKSVETIVNRCLIKHGNANGEVTFEPLNCAAKDKLGINVEFLFELALPLLGEMRWTEDREAPNFATIQELTGNDCRFDCLPDAHVVGDEEPNRV